jgi:predicted DCC family thiol-disulfide oxidoreductase YuxK
MPETPRFPLRIFYDGACIVCATEVEHYGRRDHAGRLLLVDISAPEFDPTPLEISRDELMYQMHAIDADGRVYRNVEAFWAIWQAFPAATIYGLLGRLVTLPLLNSLARIGYRIFASLRRYLPRRERECSTGSCRIGRNPPR